MRLRQWLHRIHLDHTGMLYMQIHANTRKYVPPMTECVVLTGSPKKVASITSDVAPTSVAPMAAMYHDILL